MFGRKQNHLFRLQLRWIYRAFLRFEATGSQIPDRNMNGLLCPSYPSDIGTQILGTIDPRSGTTQFEVSTQSVVQPTQGETAIQADLPRFYGPCRTTTCAHWTSSSCRLAKSVAFVRVSKKIETSSCKIRQSCRWYAEHGIQVCGGCARVEYRLISADTSAIDSSNTEQFISNNPRVM